MIKNIKLLLLVSLTIVACTKKDDEVLITNSSDGLALTSGSANFSKYVALGNSLSAGFSDGALFKEGQKGAWTNILSQRFAEIGGGEFRIPFMGDNLGGFSSSGFQVPQLPLRLYFDGCGPTKIPVATATVSGTVLGASIASAGPYNNTGIPGAKCIDLVKPGFAALNPYFGRIATSPTQTILNYAASQSPTFFSVWIGNNDVLSYALEGGDNALAQITPSAGAIGVGFDASYNSIIDVLTTNGAKGVVSNIPYVSTIPMFTTIPVKPVSPNSYFKDLNEPNCSVVYPTSAADIGTINAINTNLFGFLSNLLPARFSLLSTTDNNPLIIIDESLSNEGTLIATTAANSGNATLVALGPYLAATFGNARQSKVGDLIPLTTRGVIGTQNIALPASLLAQGLGAFGITYPLADKFVLIPSEIAEIKTATDNFNIIIKAAATAKGLAFVDANSILSQVASANGFSSNGFTVRSTFVSGGGFSLDGVHPSPRGYALIANEFIKAINATYKSNLKGVDIGTYRVMFGPSLPN